MKLPFTAYSWDKIPEEQIMPLLSRKVIWGKNQNIALIHLKKGCHVATHHHLSEQITYVLKGALKIRLDGQDVTLAEGDVLHIPSDVAHEAFALEDTLDLDVFSPIRDDWLRGEIDYMKNK
jgi:quercetin dioxygenase-like cupin family protein